MSSRLATLAQTDSKTGEHGGQGAIYTTQGDDMVRSLLRKPATDMEILVPEEILVGDGGVSRPVLWPIYCSECLDSSDYVHRLIG